MPAAPEITDRNRLNAWLDALPRNSPDEAAEAHRIVMSITFRATMRMLPVTLPILLSENARERGLTPEAIFRRLLSAGVTSICPTPATKEKAAILTDANAASTFAFASASVSDKTTALVGAYDSATTRRAAWRALDGDCQALADGNSLRLRPLWPDGNNPLEHAWQEAVSGLTKAGPERAFWIDWYEKCLAGAPQDWEGLLADIALLPSEDWDKGPKHIAELIAQLQEKHNLKARVRDLKAEMDRLIAAGASAAQRGHNNPPELVEAELRRECVTIRDRLEEAEAELDQPAPSPAVLARVGRFLVEAAAWFGAKFNTAADAFAKTIGVAGGAWVIANSPALMERLGALGRKLIDFAQRLPGGPF